MPPRKRPPPAARGYDEAHRNQVRRLHARHTDGTPCWWCGLPMYRDRTRNPDYDPHAMRRDGKPDQTSGVLHGDHNGGSLPDRLMHGKCNQQRGDGSRDDQRPALQGNTHAPNELGDLTMGWPQT